jgi:hypothetical protein
VRSETRAGRAVEGWVSRYFAPLKDDEVCWEVAVSRGAQRLPSDDVAVNEAVVRAL